jgi:cell wall-associated NlpC family hydrolase
LGIDLYEIAREDYFWKKGHDIYGENTVKQGFYEIALSDIQKHDVICLKIRSKTMANHGIIYLGGDNGLHHLPYKTSSIETISRYIDPQKEIYHSVWRHKDIK